MSADFRITIDDREVREYLGRLDEKGVIKILRAGLAKGAPTLKRSIAAEIPVKSRASAGAHGEFSVKSRSRAAVGGFITKDYGTPGGMRKSVKSRRIRSNPAIGIVVGPMGKLAFMRHWVAKGTKAHIIRPKGIGRYLAGSFGFAKLVHHPGSKPNDYTGRASSSIGAASDIAERYILEEATK